MGATRITDVIDPEILSRTVIRNVLNNIFTIPGVFAGNEFASDDPGTFWETPYQNKLGDFETYDPDTPLTVQALTQGRFGHVVQRKAAAYGEDKIVKLAANQDPMDFFSQQLTEKILELTMKQSILVFEGAIPAASRQDDGVAISRAQINKARYLLGDKAANLKWVVMHSSNKQVLDTAGEIVYQPMANILPLTKPNQFMQVATNEQNFVATVAGLIIFQSDNMPVISGTPDKYATYLTGDRAMGYYPQGSLNVDTDYDTLTKEDILSPDIDFMLSLIGTDYTDAPDYDDASLAATANYDTKWDVKEIPAIRILNPLS